MCFKQLVIYKDKRQEINNDKALAYLKWRANILRRVIAGPREGRLGQGWRDYAHKKVVRRSRNEYKVNKIRTFRQKLLLTAVMRSLKQFRITSVLKHKVYLKVDAHIAMVRKQKAIRALKAYGSVSQQKYQQKV
jgi:hypothetical protein